MNFDKDRIDDKMEKYGLECNPFRKIPYYPTDSLTGWYFNHGDIDSKKFDSDFETDNYSITCPRLKTTTIGKYWVCTIELPFDCQSKTQGYAYETMIIQDDPENPHPQLIKPDHKYQFHIPSGQGSGGWEYQERCHTKDEALLQHEKAVHYINKVESK